MIWTALALLAAFSAFTFWRTTKMTTEESLRAYVAFNRDAIDHAIAVIDSIPTRVQAAIEAANANGATIPDDTVLSIVRDATDDSRRLIASTQLQSEFTPDGQVPKSA